MLQKAAEKDVVTAHGEEKGLSNKTKTKIGPLTSRLENLEKEVEALKERTATLEGEVVGGGGAGAGAPAEALVSSDEEDADEKDDKEETYRRVMSLLADKSQGKQPTTIKDRTAALEADVGALKSAISTLENQVAGTVFSSRPALLQMQSPGSSLKSRINSLEEEVDSCRTRVSTLEHTVVG
jgi:predicted RNase H-like nuclease (RuvC/YqgF family)